MASAVIVAILLAVDKIKGARAIPTYSPPQYTHRPDTSVAQCIDYTVPITVTSENLIFDVGPFTSSLDVADLVGNFAAKDSNVTFHPVIGKENITATYEVTGTFCSPKTLTGNGREKTVLLATHGIHYDGRYWDSEFQPEQYSFVEHAVDAGFSVFFYDRVGTGRSEKVSGYTNQAAPQVEIIAQLATLLRKGTLSSSIGTPDSLVLVGHSFGSFTSGQILARYPSLADAAVLTGVAYSQPEFASKVIVEAFAPRVASQLLPEKFAELDSGYLTFADIYAHVNTFFKAPAYDVEAVKYAHSIVAPYGIGELFSLGTLNPVAPEFEGPVLVTTGAIDFAMCLGTCESTYEEQRLDILFPKVEMLETYLHPGVGHGVNLGRNATGFYDVIVDFLGRAGF